MKKRGQLAALDRSPAASSRGFRRFSTEQTMRQLNALIWKEWHETQVFLWIAWGLFIGLPIIGGLEGRFVDTGRSEFMASPWVLMLGPVLAIVVGVAVTCRDVQPKLEDFWQSRPIGGDAIVRRQILRCAGGYSSCVWRSAVDRDRAAAKRFGQPFRVLVHLRVVCRILSGVRCRLHRAPNGARISAGDRGFAASVFSADRISATQPICNFAVARLDFDPTRCRPYLHLATGAIRSRHVLCRGCIRHRRAYGGAFSLANRINQTDYLLRDLRRLSRIGQLCVIPTRYEPPDVVQGFAAG